MDFDFQDINFLDRKFTTAGRLILTYIFAVILTGAIIAAFPEGDYSFVDCLRTGGIVAAAAVIGFIPKKLSMVPVFIIGFAASVLVPAARNEGGFALFFTVIIVGITFIVSEAYSFYFKRSLERDENNGEKDPSNILLVAFMVICFFVLPSFDADINNKFFWVIFSLFTPMTTFLIIMHKYTLVFEGAETKEGCYILTVWLLLVVAIFKGNICFFNEISLCTVALLFGSFCRGYENAISLAPLIQEAVDAGKELF